MTMNPTKIQSATQPRRRSAIFIASQIVRPSLPYLPPDTAQSRCKRRSGPGFPECLPGNSYRCTWRTVLWMERSVLGTKSSNFGRFFRQSVGRDVNHLPAMLDVLGSSVRSVGWMKQLTVQWWFIRCVNLWQKLVNGFLHGCQIWGKSLNDTYLAIPTQYRFDSNPLYSFFILNTIQ